MKAFDRIIQSWRCRVARPWIPANADVLDIGCHQGEFLASLNGRGGVRVGYDPLAPVGQVDGLELIAGYFTPPTKHPDESFDAVTMLATLEHIVEKEPIIDEIRRVLRPNGVAIITLPAPAVDGIVAFLQKIGVADGMSLEEHHGFRPEDSIGLFTSRGFTLAAHRRFQLGLNNIFIFKRT